MARSETPLSGPAWDLSRGPLRVSGDGRRLVHADGSDFFWLADTVWEIFHRATREEIEHYLDRRRQQGFTVIQAVALAEYDGLHTPNAYGHVPLIDGDPARPDARDGDDYWKHIDWTIARAAAHGITVALLPTWGDKIGPRGWGIGPEVFTEETARAYGRFIGRRYRDTPNLVWVIGGDRPLIWTDGRDYRPLWRALAAGVKEGDGGAHLCTFHPVGGQSSSLWMHDEPWLDFNMLQSGHARLDDGNYTMVAADHARTPVKPVIDGEPRYENHCVNFKPENGWFDDYDVRQAAYWALFAGACGHTYGCHDVWQWLAPGRKPASHARGHWRESLDLPGAWDMQHVRTLWLSRPIAGRIPDPSLVWDGSGPGADHVEACRDADGRYALLYLPTGKPVTVHLARLRETPLVRFSWFDPRTGATLPGGERALTRETVKQEFVPPGAPGRGNDWILVIDNPHAR